MGFQAHSSHAKTLTAYLSTEEVHKSARLEVEVRHIETDTH